MDEWTGLICSTLHRGIQGSVPLVLAANGELIAERAGVVNIGIEGMMLIGALAGAAVGWGTQSALLGVIAAVVAAVTVGLVFAAWTVGGARDQIITGLAVNLLALGLTGVLAERMEAAYREPLSPPRLTPALPIRAAEAPVAHALFAHDALTLAAAPCVLATGLLLFRSRAGLAVRAVGENPAAAEAAGVRVGWVRLVAVAAGAGFAGLAGASLSMAIGDRFQENMTAGRGFVALALVIFGRWSPVRVALGALFFGGLDALQVTLQPRLGASVHLLHPALLALPYVVTLLTLARWTGRAHPPAALAVPYRSGG